MSDSEIITLRLAQARMEEKIDAILEKLDNKADKWTEKAVYGMMGCFGTLLIGLLLYLLKSHV